MHTITIEGKTIDLETIIVPPQDGVFITWDNGLVIMSKNTLYQMFSKTLEVMQNE